MEFRDLRAFLAVIDHGGMTRAAEHLYLVQSAVSQAVLRLERECGVRLLERRRDGVIPTEAGGTLAAHARSVITTMARAREDMAAYQGLRTGTTHLGLMHTAVPLVLAPLLRALAHQHPGLTLQVREAGAPELTVWLAAGQVELAIVFLPVDDPVLKVTELASFPLSVISQPGTDIHGADMRALAKRQWISFGPGHPGRRWLDEAARSAGFSAQISAEVETLAQLTDYVIAGAGLGLVPAESVAAPISAGFLDATPITPKQEARLGSARLPGHLSLAAQATVSALNRLFSERTTAQL